MASESIEINVDYDYDATIVNLIRRGPFAKDESLSDELSYEFLNWRIVVVIGISFYALACRWLRFKNLFANNLREEISSNKIKTAVIVILYQLRVANIENSWTNNADVVSEGKISVSVESDDHIHVTTHNIFE